MKIEKHPFGKTGDGTPADLYTLSNDNDMVVKITDYGCTVVSLCVPDKNGNVDDVVLGFDTLDEYISDSPFFGCIVGRYGNRIAKGAFTLNDITYSLAQNNGVNHLHGGIKGFDKYVWNVVGTETAADFARIILSFVSPDGDEGYPGTLTVTNTYTLTNNNELHIDYNAETDKPTVTNLTNHSYFNLEGAGSGSVLGHQIKINADVFTPTDEGSITTGEIRNVKGTPLDFTTMQTIGDRIDVEDEQLIFGCGYDQNWIINKTDGTPSFAARVFAPVSGRVMEVHTTEPGIQLYTGNFLVDGLVGKGGKKYGRRHALCLETQHYPDSPNHLAFPSTTLNPGELLRSTTIYSFSVKQ